jgi:hypothetical protein
MKKKFILFFPSNFKTKSAFDGLSEKMSLRENQMLQKIPQNKVDIFMVRDLKYFY